MTFKCIGYKVSVLVSIGWQPIVGGGRGCKRMGGDLKTKKTVRPQVSPVADRMMESLSQQESLLASSSEGILATGGRTLKQNEDF